MARLWFHIAAITLAADPTAVEVAKSAETVPPLPRTEWQPRQPLPRTSRRARRAPAAGGAEGGGGGGARAGGRGRRDPALLHPRPRRGPVVPHRARELRQAHVVRAAERGADRAALAPERVAGGAPLLDEELRAPLGRPRHDLHGLRRLGPRPGLDDVRDHVHQLPARERPAREAPRSAASAGPPSPPRPPGPWQRTQPFAA